MNPEKKVIFLFLSLIVLIVLCVYTHIDTIKVAQTSTVEKEVTTEPIAVKDEPEVNKEEVVIEEEPVLQKEEQTSEIKNNEEEQTDIKEPEEINQETTTLEEENKEQTVSSEETPIQEEVIEEPLVTTGDKYIREGSEKKIEDLSKEAQLLQLKMSDYIKENPIIFKRASNKITKSSNKSIKTIVKALEEFPNIKIEIAGHTDAVGAAKLNQAISLQRAKSVMNRLVYYGIDKNRMIARGYGEDIPLVANSPKGYSKVNRRVEFNIVEE